MSLYKLLVYYDELHRHPPAADNCAIAHLRTAALLGTPSKKLLSGTPELVRGLRQILSCYRFWLIFNRFFSRDSEAILVSVDERPSVTDKGTTGLSCLNGNGF
jgi:hypothetical protein